MPTLKLFVQNLADHQDEQRVVSTVMKLDGVFAAVANHEGHCLEVDFEDDDVSVAEISHALRTAGYEVQLAG